MAVRPAALNLVQAAQHGDESAFELLLEPLLEHGYRLACAMLHDHSAAEDAVQEAAFRAWRKVAQLRDPIDMRPWFLTIVANQCRSVRRGRWWSVVRLPSLDRAGADFETSSVEIADLQRGLANLSAEDRLPLFLHFYLDLPLEEVGAVLGLSAAGAKTRVYRAARKLRPGLELD